MITMYMLVILVIGQPPVVVPHSMTFEQCNKNAVDVLTAIYQLTKKPNKAVCIEISVKE